MPKNKNLVHQVQEVLKSKLCINESKYDAKRQGVAKMAFTHGAHIKIILPNAARLLNE